MTRRRHSVPCETIAAAVRAGVLVAVPALDAGGIEVVVYVPALTARHLFGPPQPAVERELAR